MRFDQFKNFITDTFDRYIGFLNGNLSDITGRNLIPLFPTQIYFTETTKHFSFELVGASVAPKRLQSKVRKCSEINSYFDMFGRALGEQKPFLVFPSREENSGVTLHGLGFLAGDSSELEDRFPAIKNYHGGLVGPEMQGSFAEFSPDLEAIFFQDCIASDQLGDANRIKHVLFFGLFARKLSEARMRSELERCFNNGKGHLGSHIPIGVTEYDQNQDQNYMTMVQLQSLFLSSGVHETSIGGFLNSHPELVKRVFGTDDFVYEPTFEWIEHDGQVTETAINPDLLVKRKDGYFDIVDLKLAGITKRSLTKGKRSRRRFVDYVNEGLNQLANYEEYFSFEKNAELAANKYGVKVFEPRLILVVGNQENMNEEEVREALRIYKGRKLTIINYDTVAQMAVSGKSGSMGDVAFSADL